MDCLIAVEGSKMLLNEKFRLAAFRNWSADDLEALSAELLQLAQEKRLLPRPNLARLGPSSNLAHRPTTGDFPRNP